MSLSTRQVLKLAVFGVYLADSYHCYEYIRKYYDGMDDIEDEEIEEMVQAYEEKSDMIIDRESFLSRLYALEMELIENDANPLLSTFRTINEPSLKVARESIIFALGGRAALLQLCHPFVAAGIRSHSNLSQGVSQRFFRTFHYMFRVTFGTRKDAFDAAKSVRRLHDKVKGKIDEDVGIFNKEKSKFNAAHTEALRWVGATLTEGMIVAHELFIGSLTIEEKNAIVVHGDKVAALFGIPKSKKRLDWKTFKRYNMIMWKSKILTVSDCAKDITKFLFEPPSPFFAPLMRFIHWGTICALPTRLGEQLYHRKITKIDKIILALFQGVIRFLYRFLPGSFRFLNPYLEMEKRVGIQRSWIANFLSKLSASLAHMFLAAAMPPRDPSKISK